MQKKRTFGGKKKYKFEPKVIPEEVPVSGTVDKKEDGEFLQEPVLQSQNQHKKCTSSKTRKALGEVECEDGVSSVAANAGSEIKNVVFEHENDPQCIKSAERRVFPFCDGCNFILEIPEIENGEFVVYSDNSYALVGEKERAAMVPVPEVPQIAVEFGEGCVYELGVVSQSYVGEAI